MSIAAGFRGPKVGIDTSNYYFNIQNFFPYSWQFREFGFRLFSNTVMYMTKNPQMVFVLCAFITNTLIVLRLWDFKNVSDFSFMVLLYELLYFSNSMNIMRQYVAAALIFYSTRFLKKNKAFIFIFFLAVAFSFHRSSLLGVGYLAIALWLSFSKNQRKLLFLPMFAALIVCVLYVNSYFSSDFESYSAQAVSNINIPYFYRVFALLISLLLEYKKCGVKLGSFFSPVHNSKAYFIDKDVTLYYLIGISFSALSMFFAFVGRTGLYYMLYEVVYWGIASKQSKNKRLNILLILIFAFYEFIQVFTRNSVGIFPYYIFLYK